MLDAKAEKLPELVARFQREAIAGAHVQHANIASATDFGQLDDGSYFLVLEYVAGRAAERADRRRGRFRPNRAVAIARQIAQGLGAAHEVGVIHRDVKPNNVMLVGARTTWSSSSTSGSRRCVSPRCPRLHRHPMSLAHPEKALTSVGVVLGTVAYMAPEAALGMLAVDARSDLYALGLVLYELLAGKHPFEATEPVQLFLQQRTMPPPADRARGHRACRCRRRSKRSCSSCSRRIPKIATNRRRSSSRRSTAVMMATNFEVIPELALRNRRHVSRRRLWTGGAFLRLPRGLGARHRSSRAMVASRDGRTSRFPVRGAFHCDARSPSLAMRPAPPAGSSTRVRPAALAAPAESGTPGEAREVAVEVGGLDAAGWRISLRNAAREKDWAKGADAVMALLQARSVGPS